MGFTTEQPSGQSYTVDKRVIALHKDGYEFVLHAVGEVVDADRAKALEKGDAEALGVVSVRVEGEDKPKAKASKADDGDDDGQGDEDEDDGEGKGEAGKRSNRARTAKRPAPGR